MDNPNVLTNDKRKRQVMFSKVTFGDSHWGKVRREGPEMDRSEADLNLW